MAWTTPGTAVAGDVLTAAFWNEQVRDNTDFLYDEVFKGFTSWTPTYTGITVGTGGNAANTGAYLRLGNIVIFYGSFVLGTSGFSVSGDPTLTLPVTPMSNTGGDRIAFGINVAFDVSNSSKAYSGNLYTGNAGTSVFFSSDQAIYGRFAATAPFTWAAGDSCYFSGLYVVS